jgi:ABC-type sugar transport system ATPase subunit
LRLPIPSGRFDVKAGQSVTLGLRPEDLVPDGHGLPPRSSIDMSAPVSLTEMLGNETLLFITFGGTELVARMQQPREVAPDELMLFRINVDRIHLFDAATGVSTRVPVAARGPSTQEADVRPH